MIKIEAGELAQVDLKVKQLVEKSDVLEKDEAYFNLSSATYYLSGKCDERFRHNVAGILTQMSGIDHSPLLEGERLSVPNLAVNGILRIEYPRKGPLAIARLYIRQVGTYSQFRGVGGYDPMVMVGRLFSPQAFEPFHHLIVNVDNLDANGSVYTIDQEGSHWSLHLAGSGFDYENFLTDDFFQTKI